MKLTKFTIIEIVITALILATYQSFYTRPSTLMVIGIFIGVGLVIEVVKRLMVKGKKEKEVSSN